jgi:hypothetical protein
VTEKEWLAATDPAPMLAFLRGRVSERKFRLFSVACCRRLGPLLKDTRVTTALDMAEQHADGTATQAELDAALRGAAQAQRAQRRKALLFACAAVMDACGPGGLGAAEKVAWAEAAATDSRVTYGDYVRRTRPDLYASLAEQLREVIGNPLLPLSPLPPAVLAWKDRTVPRLAQAAYDDRRLPDGTLDPARLGIMADALLDAGCTDEDLMAHLRSDGAHVRGCFAVDIVMGRQ